MRTRFTIAVLTLLAGTCFSFALQGGGASTPAATSAEEQEIINLSKQKWQWMADKDVAQLEPLFHEKAVFVHMGGSWGKQQELRIIESGGIHYKKADIHEVSVNIIGDTAILLNRITLLAVVGGREVTNPFEVTEVYVRPEGRWQLAALAFTRLLTPGEAPRRGETGGSE
ncbi:MAG: hypothetical protein Kow00109_15950 [Acidobacteriota bacterium]